MSEIEELLNDGGFKNLTADLVNLKEMNIQRAITGSCSCYS